MCWQHWRRERLLQPHLELRAIEKKFKKKNLGTWEKSRDCLLFETMWDTSREKWFNSYEYYGLAKVNNLKLWLVHSQLLIIIFTAIASNLAIWLAALPKSSHQCVTQCLLQLSKTFNVMLIQWQKTNWMWFRVVWTLLYNEMGYHSGQKFVVGSPRLRAVSPRHFGPCDNAYRCR